MGRKPQQTCELFFSDVCRKGSHFFSFLGARNSFYGWIKIQGAGGSRACASPAGPSRGPAEAQQRVGVLERLPGWCVRDRAASTQRAEGRERFGGILRTLKEKRSRLTFSFTLSGQASCWQSGSSVNTSSCQSFFGQGHQPRWDCERLSLASLHIAIPPSWDQPAGKWLPCLVQRFCSDADKSALRDLRGICSLINE